MRCHLLRKGFRFCDQGAETFGLETPELSFALVRALDVTTQISLHLVHGVCVEQLVINRRPITFERIDDVVDWRVPIERLNFCHRISPWFACVSAGPAEASLTC